MSAPLLDVENLQAGYGDSRVLFDISLSVHPGEVVTLMGRNGMGKTTTIMTILGMLKAEAGVIRIDGRDMTASLPTGSRRPVSDLFRGAAGISDPDGGGKSRSHSCPAVRAGLDAQDRLRSLSPAGRAPAQSRHPAIGWGTADACHRAGTDDQSEAPDPR